MNQSNSKAQGKCFLDTGLYESCIGNCKSVLSYNTWLGNLESLCIARKKLDEFMEGSNTFSVAISAFTQCQPAILDIFASKSEAALDLIRYFFSISEPEETRQIAEKMSNEILYRILAKDYENFVNIQKMVDRRKAAVNYFAVKSSAFWKLMSQERLCSIIVFLVRDVHEYKLAAQFLMILSPEVISQFTKFTNLSEDDERNLFLALEDNIYNIPLVSPKIYGHMLELFKDEFEIFFVLETMGPLVKRRAEIEDISMSFLRYHKRTGQKLSIQWIYSELFGLEYELVVEILNQLMENEFITLSEKHTLQALLKTGSLESLSEVKLEILNQ
ncbi:MAG TPA: hypothetical protein PL048_03305 [Leptospiraceae bacterium]|nr:hypothetical protein [Leptospiraceae bacterium]HMY67465.1 hypothetical protein [Leptospiraceae bacterium]HMZ57776.1 hypothetical protein [Leptospiraceae bacterium]HNF14285.1 hypothetical protein [Leptospiraceae bacterium]HNF23668.1 hypothetical protein [Leptospiraceae bacterium]